VRITIRIPAAPAWQAGAATAAEFTERVRRADAYGFDRISVGDTQLNSMECYTALAVVALNTRNAQFGPGVTNPVTRDVGVLANTLASLDVFGGGRAFCLLARGDGAVYNAGLRPASVDQTREYFIALRDLLHTGQARLGQRLIRLPWAGKYQHKVPLYLVAEGPRMLRMAGEIADGVFVGAGLTPPVVRTVLAAIREGAQAVGRDLVDLDIWWDTRSGIALTPEDALYRARESIASAGNHAFRAGFEGKGVPPELHQRLRDYQRRFDYAQKGTSVQNGPLMEELGLAGYFAERFGVVGTPEQVVARLRELERLGVTQVSMASHNRGLKGVPDSIDLLGEHVLPAVRSAAASPASR
jgi:5,10-methylenetetrahydromethanopterin reductase